MTNHKALESLTTPDERKEFYSAVKQQVYLHVEKKQKTYVADGDRIRCVGYLRMWTILNPFYDKNGFNRQFSTFGEWGLQELGIIPVKEVK